MGASAVKYSVYIYTSTSQSVIFNLVGKVAYRYIYTADRWKIQDKIFVFSKIYAYIGISIKFIMEMFAVSDVE